jgi:hypothetical protein
MEHQDTFRIRLIKYITNSRNRKVPQEQCVLKVKEKNRILLTYEEDHYVDDLVQEIYSNIN